MRESNVTNEDLRTEESDELEPLTIGPISEVTGTAGDGGGDRINVVWGDF